MYSQAHFEDVIFKGGTSLEKLRLVQRFSEDLDLLVVGSHGNKTDVKRKLRALCEAARSAVGGELTGVPSGGEVGSLHRRAYLHPPLERQPRPGSALSDPSQVLLEFGQSGGPNPHSARSVASMLTRQLESAGFPITDYVDLAPFRVNILHPGRTLLEKLLRVNNFAAREAARDTPHGWPRIGRQFYDIWSLLGPSEVLPFLADRATAASVLADRIVVSQQFTSVEPPPKGASRSPRHSPPKGRSAPGYRRSTTQPCAICITAPPRDPRLTT